MENYNEVKDNLIKWIRDWFDKNGPDSPAVIGLSGGKDSTVVAALCCEALGKDRVIGVMMPNGEQSDIATSIEVVEYLGIRNLTVNISESYEAVKSSIGMELSPQALLNLAPRLRMTTLYAVSQSFNGRVSNNCNLSENYVGYSTIFGDAAGDFSPLANLTVTEVKEVGRCLGLPEKFIEKPPSDGLSGKTDEDNFGFTYAELDRYIRTGLCENEVKKALIDKRHRQNLFKMRPMEEFKYEVSE